MDESKIEMMPTTTEQSIVPTQKKTSSDLMTAEKIEKEIAENKEKLKELERPQDLINKEFVYFEKCPVRYIETKDNNGNELKGFKFKNKSTQEEKFSTLNKLTATQDILLFENIAGSAESAQPRNQKKDNSVNVINQVLADYEPKDSLEAKLCLQAHTLYSQGMQYLSRAESSKMIPQSDFYMKNALKLLRLHNETIDALNKHRRGGEQRVIVQHVNVEEGAQAIVNNGNMVGGGGGKN